jgi:hypothetical protein
MAFLSVSAVWFDAKSIVLVGQGEGWADRGQGEFGVKQACHGVDGLETWCCAAKFDKIE